MAATVVVDRHRPGFVDPAVLASTIAQQPARGSARVWWSAEANGPADARRLALTFDDGPTEQYTPGVLEALAVAGVVATFFAIGELAVRHPDLLRRVRDAGHELGNHSFDHVSAVRLDAPDVRDGMARGADVIEKVTGVRTRWYRPPRGEITSATLLAARSVQQDVALWSVVRNGEDGGGADDDVPGVRRHLLAAVHPGAVVDVHDGIGRSSFDGAPDPQLVSRRDAEVSALPDVLAGWKAAGYRFVTLSELIPG